MIGEQAKTIAIENGINEKQAHQIKGAIGSREYTRTKGWGKISHDWDETAIKLGWKREWNVRLNLFPKVENNSGGSRKNKRRKTLRKKARKLSKRKNKRKTLKNRR
jgi:hypothetical protein